MSEDVPQIVVEDAASASAVEHHVMEILNPGLHHHDLLQSYVHVEVGSNAKQDPEEFEEPSKEGYSSKHSKAASGGSAHDKGKRSSDKKEKERSDTVIDSEMRIQKSRRK